MIDIFSRSVLAAAAPRGLSSAAFPAAALACTLAPAQLLDLIRESGLEGKGGAGFPAHRKLALMQAQPAGRRYLVVNGGEHEPGSAKDRHLLENYSRTVLEGALICARAAGARHILIAINKGQAQAAALMEQAITEWRRTSADGQAPHVAVAPIPESYIVGEESALLEALAGGPALPRKRPPHPIESGLHDSPTLVHNVETVAHLPYIVLHGSQAYRALGRNGQAATLCTFGPEFANEGVRLVPLGITLQELLDEHGGGLKSGKPAKAVQPGGPSAGLLPRDRFGTPFDRPSLKQAGSALGCGAVRAFAEDEDVVQAVAGIAAFFADSSCGQCPACRMQTQMLSTLLKQLRAGRGSRQLLRQIPVIVASGKGKGDCGLIGMPAAPILSALEEFGHEFEACLPDDTPAGAPQH